MSLADLPAFARDLWWTTDPVVHTLWAAIDPHLWDASGHNPVAMLKMLNVADIDEALLPVIEAAIERWPRGARAVDSPTQRRIAYFCMEFGLHEGLPIYSGGLGMLAGDHLRSAADLGIDLVGVGLLYREGYFTQSIEDGRQVAQYPTHDPARLPLTRIRGADGQPVVVRVPNGDDDYAAAAWEARIGHVRLFLLDTGLPENPESVRELTQRLYGGDEQVRLHQEVLLGFGGKSLLDTLGIQPDVFHMNEGHAAFLVTSLIAEAVARGQTPEAAWNHTRQRCVFTTHTPVPAGHDRFDPAAVTAVLGPTCTTAGLSQEDWLTPAVLEGDGSPQFCMSTLAIRGSRAVNGVSKLHAQVSQGMFEHLNTDIRPITNGVHPTAWMASETADLLDAHLTGWRERISDPGFWSRTVDIPTGSLLDVRRTLRGKLVDAVRAAVGSEVLDHDKLTLGFARRFAPYKRANLIFSQPDRLAAILDRGVQIVFAGKAHPQDPDGVRLIEEVIRWTQDPRFAGRIVFVPGYDPHWGRCMTAGADVWLNTPRRPREASGTSGQKAALNGNPNLSVLDGWWPEACDGDNGWAIPGGSDDEDALALYEILENQVLPSFDDAPGWARMMQHVMATCIPVFNTDRMLRDYCVQLYDPVTE